MASGKADARLFVRVWPDFAARYGLTPAIVLGALYWYSALSDKARELQKKKLLESHPEEAKFLAGKKHGDIPNVVPSYLMPYFFIPVLGNRLSYSEMAERTGLHRSTVIDAVHVLVGAGVLKIKNPKHEVNLIEFDHFDLGDVLVMNGEVVKEPKAFLIVYADEVRKHGAKKAAILGQIRLKTSTPKKQGGKTTWFDPVEFERYLLRFMSRPSKFRLLSQMTDDGLLLRAKIEGVWCYRCAPAPAPAQSHLTTSTVSSGDQLGQNQSHLTTS